LNFLAIDLRVLIIGKTSKQKPSAQLVKSIQWIHWDAFVGAHSAIRFGATFIRPVFVTVVSVLAIKLAYEAWFVNL
jgi:hypothetical protein